MPSVLSCCQERKRPLVPISSFSEDCLIWTNSGKTTIKSSTPYLKKLQNQAYFVRPLSNFHRKNFWHKDGKEDKLMSGALIFHLIEFMSMHYRVKCRCSKLLHNAVIISLQCRLYRAGAPKYS